MHKQTGLISFEPPKQIEKRVTILYGSFEQDLQPFRFIHASYITSRCFITQQDLMVMMDKHNSCQRSVVQMDLDT